MAFTAGQKIRAWELNNALGVLAYQVSDQSVVSSATLVNSSGLVLPVEANAKYALDGWFYYQSNSTADIKFNITGPTGWGGTWSIWGPNLNSAPIAGSQRKNYIDTGTVLVTNSLALEGDTEFANVWASAQPKGYITTGGTAGNLTVQFAQNTSNATATILKAGCWIRMFRLA